MTEQDTVSIYGNDLVREFSDEELSVIDTNSGRDCIMARDDVALLVLSPLYSGKKQPEYADVALAEQYINYAKSRITVSKTLCRKDKVTGKNSFLYGRMPSAACIRVYLYLITQVDPFFGQRKPRTYALSVSHISACTHMSTTCVYESLELLNNMDIISWVRSEKIGAVQYIYAFKHNPYKANSHGALQMPMCTIQALIDSKCSAYTLRFVLFSLFHVASLSYRDNNWHNSVDFLMYKNCVYGCGNVPAINIRRDIANNFDWCQAKSAYTPDGNRLKLRGFELIIKDTYLPYHVMPDKSTVAFSKGKDAFDKKMKIALSEIDHHYSSGHNYALHSIQVDNSTSDNFGFTLGTFEHALRRNIDNGSMTNIVSALTHGTIDEEHYTGRGIQYFAVMLHNTIQSIAYRYGIAVATQTIETALTKTLRHSLIRAFSGKDYNENKIIASLVNISNVRHTALLGYKAKQIKEQRQLLKMQRLQLE